MRGNREERTRDPVSAERWALRGRVVTQDDAGTVWKDGVIYGEGAEIRAVLDAADAVPDGFSGIPRRKTGCTLLPGLIELHNHLAYNALPLWFPKKRYDRREQWANEPEYRDGVTGTMAVLAAGPDLLPVVVRWVECRCLLGGVTTSQGIRLSSGAGIVRHFRGVVRNVEATDAPDLPSADTRIADVAATDREAFAQRTRERRKLLLHLAEGVDGRAREHFRVLQDPHGAWALGSSLVAIHATALLPQDWPILAEHGVGVVWSPLSNLLLYGGTTGVREAREVGVKVALGSDWTVSGSRNLLAEMKVARAVSDATDSGLTDRDILDMATRTPASLLGWEGRLGSLQAGRRADVLAVAGTSGEPYSHILGATEADLRLVMVGGVPRFGTPAFMGTREGNETMRVGSRKRVLHLVQEEGDPTVAALSLTQTRARLTEVLGHLAEKAKEWGAGERTRSPGSFWLDLDEEAGKGSSPRWLGGYREERDGGEEAEEFRAPLPPLWERVKPVTLEPLTVAEDPGYWERIRQQVNLPQEVRALLPH